jgi:hypothetical protein
MIRYGGRTSPCYAFEVKEEPGELVFLVRMWLRAGEKAPDREWRGSVHEINSGVRYYVTGARDVADFIGARLAVRER